MIKETEGGGFIITGSDIEVYRFFARKGALKLEILGLKHSCGSVYAICKKVYGLKGSKQKVLDQMEEIAKQITGEKK